MASIDIGSHIRKNELIYYYDDIIIYKIISLCSSQGDLIDYCNPALLTLMDFDKKNGTSYVQTLFVFSGNMNNHMDTANTLHIHRNTLIYRLKKIEEIMGISLNDSYIILHILMSFRILEYLEMDFM